MTKKKIIANIKSLTTSINSIENIKDDKFSYSFSTNKKQYNEKKILILIKEIRSSIQKLKISDYDLNQINFQESLKLVEICNNLLINKKNQEALKLLSSLEAKIQALDIVAEKEFKFTIPMVPEPIRQEVISDFKEISKCFDAGCYRATTILLGRILETALHRKYYEVTKNDLLETNPNIGLGKLIAKLTEKNIRFEPGMNDQIHLINKVRIDSVHKKKDSFNPSKGAAEAMILYTIDILNKLF